MSRHLVVLGLLAAALVATVAAQGTKGGYAAQPTARQPFYATKGGTKTPAASEQVREAALPAFVEPPPSPNPEPDDARSEPGMPYSFSYTAEATGGMSARSESSDGTTVRGSYMMQGPDGIDRVVHYIADKDGYRATITTNEPGTESQNPAGVIMNSSQLPAEQIALAYGPGEPYREPQPSAPVVQFQPALRAAPLPQFQPALRSAPVRVAQFAQAAPVAPLPDAPIREGALSPFRLPESNNFGFRHEIRHDSVPFARSAGVKGAPPPARKAPLFVTPIKSRPAPVQQLQAQQFLAPAPLAPPPPARVFLAPAPLPAPLPRPAPVQFAAAAPLPVLRSAGKQTLARNPRPFFKPTTAAPLFFDEQQQQQQVQEEEPEVQQQQQKEEEPEPTQQREQLLLDEPQQKETYFRSRRA